MKVLLFLFTMHLLPCPMNTQAPSKAEELKSLVSTLMSGEEINFGTLTLDPGGQTLSGTATLFGKEEAQVRAEYLDGKASLSLSFPDRNGLGIDHDGWKNLSGAKLKEFVPKELERSINLRQMSFRLDTEKREVESVELNFQALQSWDLLEGKVLTLNDALIAVTITAPADKRKRDTKVFLTGNTKFGQVPVELSGPLTTNKEELSLSGRVNELRMKETLSSLVGTKSVAGLSLPDAVVDLQLDEGTVTVAPYQKWTRIEAATNWRLADLFFQRPRKKGQQMEYVVTITTPTDFKLSKISDKLKMMDAFSLGGQRIVLSSADKKKEETSKIPSLAQVKSGIKQGCSFLADLDLTKLKLDKLLKVSSLYVTTQLNQRLDGMTFAGALGTDLDVGPSAKLTNVEFRLTPAPKDFAVALVGIMATRVNGDELQFTGGMEVGVSDQSLGFMALMQGDWNDPLGVKGMTLKKVGVQMGASFTTAPVILPQLGFTGDIYMGDVRGQATLSCDTRNPGNTMIAAGFNELRLDQVVTALLDKGVRKKLPSPLMKSIQEIGLRDVALEVVPLPVTVLEQTYEQGMRVNGKVDVMGWGGEAALAIDPTSGIVGSGAMDPIETKIFSLTGAGKHAHPQLSLNLTTRSPGVAINGEVKLLGVSALTDIAMVGSGFKFRVGGKIFNLFEADINASTNSLTRPTDLALDVYMRNDLREHLTRAAIARIEDITADSRRNIRLYRSLISKAQQDVDNWDRQIAQVKKIVEADQAADLKKVRAHEAKVNKAQRAVDGINKEIAKKNRELKAATGIKNIAKRGSLRTQIAALWVSHKTATGTLNAYKATALKVLKGVNTNPYTDPRLTGLIASQKAAAAVLVAEQKKLDALEWSLGATGEVATFIVDKGSAALLNIKEADFSGKLGSVEGGRVSLRTKVEWMNKEKELAFDFNFRDIGSGVKTMVDSLMGK